MEFKLKKYTTVCVKLCDKKYLNLKFTAKILMKNQPWGPKSVCGKAGHKIRVQQIYQLQPCALD